MNGRNITLWTPHTVQNMKGESPKIANQLLKGSFIHLKTEGEEKKCIGGKASAAANEIKEGGVTNIRNGAFWIGEKAAFWESGAKRKKSANLTLRGVVARVGERMYRVLKI